MSFLKAVSLAVAVVFTVTSTSGGVPLSSDSLAPKTSLENGQTKKKNIIDEIAGRLDTDEKLSLNLEEMEAIILGLLGRNDMGRPKILRILGALSQYQRDGLELIAAEMGNDAASRLERAFAEAEEYKRTVKKQQPKDIGVFLEGIGITDSLDGGSIFGRGIREWVEENNLFYKWAEPKDLFEEGGLKKFVENFCLDNSENVIRQKFLEWAREIGVEKEAERNIKGKYDKHRLSAWMYWLFRKRLAILAEQKKEERLFNIFDIGGMKLKDLPIWPVDENGDVREDLIGWMRHGAGPTGDYYQYPNKLSISGILDRFPARRPASGTATGSARGGRSPGLKNLLPVIITLMFTLPGFAGVEPGRAKEYFAPLHTKISTRDFGIPKVTDEDLEEIEKHAKEPAFDPMAEVKELMARTRPDAVIATGSSNIDTGRYVVFEYTASGSRNIGIFDRSAKWTVKAVDKTWKGFDAALVESPPVFSGARDRAGFDLDTVSVTGKEGQEWLLDINRKVIVPVRLGMKLYDETAPLPASAAPEIEPAAPTETATPSSGIAPEPLRGGRIPRLTEWLSSRGWEGWKLDAVQVFIEQTLWAAGSVAGLWIGLSLIQTVAAVALPFFIIHYVGTSAGLSPPGRADILFITFLNVAATVFAASSPVVLSAALMAVAGPIHYLYNTKIDAMNKVLLRAVTLAIILLVSAVMTHSRLYPSGKLPDPATMSDLQTLINKRKPAYKDFHARKDYILDKIVRRHGPPTFVERQASRLEQTLDNRFNKWFGFYVHPGFAIKVTSFIESTDKKIIMVIHTDAYGSFRSCALLYERRTDKLVEIKGANIDHFYPPYSGFDYVEPIVVRAFSDDGTSAFITYSVGYLFVDLSDPQFPYVKAHGEGPAFFDRRDSGHVTEIPLSDAAGHADPVVRELAAKSLRASAGSLRKLAADPVPAVRAAVADNKSTPADVLDLLSKDPDPSVRARVAKNGAISTDIIWRLSSDPDPLVRESLASHNHGMPVAVIFKLLADPVKAVRDQGLNQYRYKFGTLPPATYSPAVFPATPSAPIAPASAPASAPADVATSPLRGGRIPGLTNLLSVFGLKGWRLDAVQVFLEQLFWAAGTAGGLWYWYPLTWTLPVVTIFFVGLHYVTILPGRAPPRISDVLAVVFLNAITVIIAPLSPFWIAVCLIAGAGPIHYFYNRYIAPSGAKREGEGIVPAPGTAAGVIMRTANFFLEICHLFLGKTRGLSGHEKMLAGKIIETYSSALGLDIDEAAKREIVDNRIAYGDMSRSLYRWSALGLMIHTLYQAGSYLWRGAKIYMSSSRVPYLLLSAATNYALAAAVCYVAWRASGSFIAEGWSDPVTNRVFLWGRMMDSKGAAKDDGFIAVLAHELSHSLGLPNNILLAPAYTAVVMYGLSSDAKDEKGNYRCGYSPLVDTVINVVPDTAAVEAVIRKIMSNRRIYREFISYKNDGQKEEYIRKVQQGLKEKDYRMPRYINEFFRPWVHEYGMAMGYVAARLCPDLKEAMRFVSKLGQADDVRELAAYFAELKGVAAAAAPQRPFKGAEQTDEQIQGSKVFYDPAA